VVTIQLKGVSASNLFQLGFNEKQTKKFLDEEKENFGQKERLLDLSTFLVFNEFVRSSFFTSLNGFC